MPVNNVVLRGNGATITFESGDVVDLKFEYDEVSQTIIVDGLSEERRQEVIDYFYDETNYEDLGEIFPWFRVIDAIDVNVAFTPINYSIAGPTVEDHLQGLDTAVPTNLSLGTITGTTVEINNDSGTNVTLPPVNLTQAGLMIATDKVKLDGIEPLAKDDQDAFEVPVVPTGNLGSADVQAALVELQTDIDNLFGLAGATNFIADNGAPGGATGANGDYYLDVITGDVYGPKTLGAWGATIGNAYIVPLATAPPPASTNALGAVGVSGNAAREDHEHPVQQADVTPVSYAPLNYALPASGDVEAHLEEVDIALGLVSPIVQTTGADLVVPSSTLTSTGLAFTMVAGQQYRVSFLGTFQSNTATTNGCILQINTAETAIPQGYFMGTSSIGTGAGSMLNRQLTFNTSFVIPATNPINTNHYIGFEFFIRSASGGTLDIRFAAELNGQTSRLRAGSTMIIQRFL